MEILKIWESKALQKFQEILERSFFAEEVENTVNEIIKDVHQNKDEALIKYTRRFDGVQLTSLELKISPQEIMEAYDKVERDFLKVIDLVRKNIIQFHQKELRKSWLSKRKSNVILGQYYQSLKKVGIYIPGGEAPLVSTLLMTGVLAKIAKVGKIVMVSPPQKNKKLNPYLLVTANKIGIDEIYKVGGAQAIAALTFGTQTIPKVDKIVGPGNKYVMAAKRQVFGYVGIEMLPGPSEIVILADKKANPSFVIADLLAQAEHLMGLAILVTTSQELAQKVGEKVKDGYIIITKNLKEALQIINEIAPEHLEVMVENPLKILPSLKNVGMIFLGAYTPTAVGDYMAGPSHILPTGGGARFSSGLSVNDFRKRSNIIFYPKKELVKAKKTILQLTQIEKMSAHANSIKVRM